MTQASSPQPRDDRHGGAADGPPEERLRHAIEHAAHLLPAQGPITVFIHHNTLHAFEHLPFTEAVEAGAKVFGCQPYLAEDRYREELARGRIRPGELEAILREELRAGTDETVLRNTTRLELRMAMLLYPLRHGPADELRWHVAETDALRKVRSEASAAARGRLIGETRRWVLRDLRGGNEAGRDAPSLAEAPGPRGTRNLAALLDRFGEARIEDWPEPTWEAFTLQSLWRVCCDAAGRQPSVISPKPPRVRHRDLLLSATGTDTDLLVHELLITFCGAFLDQGLTHWQLPRRDEGFLKSFSAAYGHRGGPPVRWRAALADELQAISRGDAAPLEQIEDSLHKLGVPESEWEGYLSETLLALRGWAGMIRFLEERPDRAVHPIPRGSLVEYLAVRLLLERLALEHTARDEWGYRGSLAELRDELRRAEGPPPQVSAEQRAFPVFQLAQVFGWTPEELHRLPDTGWATLFQEIESFAEIRRRRVFHLAYERRFTTQTLDALCVHNQSAPETPRGPRFQALFCIDEREESIRRHVEELAPEAVTYGIAGFYFLPMYYRGAADAHFVPLCPPVMLPKHWVVEQALEGEGKVHDRRTRARRALGRASHQLHVGSRTFAVGALLSAAGGMLASIPLVARTIFPRLTARLRRSLGRIVLDPPRTRLLIERSATEPGEQPGQIGYSVEEMAGFSERVLRDTGLTSNFARIVLTLGHGSTSMNNPHESAHDCGACGGARGGPNGRAMAQILNDRRVRETLSQRGLAIPDETHFVGGMHNTSNESVTFYDVDAIPPTHQADFQAVQAIIEQACDRDAHERCRRFESAALTLPYFEARRHVEGRAEDLAQVRPEWGHATNAICVVGRRARTRGLFLDRRAFLNSYDPAQDDDQASILLRILSAAMPVCSGISLEYYFSYVDNTGYGCGTKLPHNIASLLGVMDGAASDLRTGLPWQMVEIHEPVRILFVIETTPEKMQGIIDRNETIARLVKNDWIQLALLDPASPDIRIYRDGAFVPYEPVVEELPRAASSVDWYRGWRDHLEFARIAAIT